MKFWQNFSFIQTDQQVECARFAEEVGFEGVMHGDHTCFPEVIRSPYPLSEDGTPVMQTDWNYPDLWVTIAAQAAVTTRLRFASAVYVMPTRHPIITAKATGTLALISGNRAIIGVAPGWMREEFDAVGVPFERRGARLDEAIEVTRKLWRGGTVEHHGEFYDFGPTRMEPMPGYELPVYIGGSTEAAWKRAARLGDGWIGAGNAPEEIPDLIAMFRRLREEAGRADKPFETIFPLIRPTSVDELKRLHEAGMDGLMSIEMLGADTSLDEKKRAMEKYAKEYIRAFE